MPYMQKHFCLHSAGSDNIFVFSSNKPLGQFKKKNFDKTQYSSFGCPYPYMLPLLLAKILQQLK